MIKISKESCPLKVSKFFCKGVLRFFVLSNKEADFTNFSLHTDGTNNIFSSSMVYKTTRKNHVFLFSKNRFFLLLFLRIYRYFLLHLLNEFHLLEDDLLQEGDRHH